MGALLKDLAVGTAAGVAGFQALGATTEYMWNRTSPENIAKEQSIEARDPFIVLADRVSGYLNQTWDDTTKLRFEKVVQLSTSVGAGILYVQASRKWPYGRISGALAFGALFFLLEDELGGSVMGLVGDNRKYPVEAHVRGLVAHTTFALAAALVTRLFLGTEARSRPSSSVGA